VQAAVSPGLFETRSDGRSVVYSQDGAPIGRHGATPWLQKHCQQAWLGRPPAHTPAHSAGCWQPADGPLTVATASFSTRECEFGEPLAALAWIWPPSKKSNTPASRLWTFVC